MIGIIIPPGQIKKLVQKTAHHVAANGSQFQKMILQRQQHNAQFSFLQKDNPYRAYYDHMVADISRKMIQQAQAKQKQNHQVKQQQINDQNIQQQNQQIDLLNNNISHIKHQQLQKKVQNKQAQFLQRVFEEIKQPDTDRFTAEQPQKITQAQIAIIHHTAQYVAKIGKDFLMALSQRQKSNPQFEFLKTSSQNHEYFVKMYQAYQNLLNLSQTDLMNLQQITTNKDIIFDKCTKIFEYHSLKQKQSKGKKQQNDDTKKQTNVDWNDYQIVQTIVFEGMNKNNKNLNNNKDNVLKLNKNSMGMNNQNFLSSNNQFSGRNMQQKIISLPKKKQILQQCHICRNNILASQMTKHLKTCLGQKKRPNPVDNSKIQYSNSQVDIRKNLQSLSNKRPDIFGGDGAKITRRENTEDEGDKIIWDGQAPNISRTTASIAMVNNQQKKIKEELKKN